jgi:hypothetical protein
MNAGFSNILVSVLICMWTFITLTSSANAQPTSPRMEGSSSTGGQVAPGIITQHVEFKKGFSSTTVKGTIQGDQIRDYVLDAKAGQTMTVKMNSKNRFLYFNVLKDKDATALFSGQTATKPNQWAGKLRASGDYTIRVYLVQAEASPGGKADFQFTVSIKK